MKKEYLAADYTFYRFPIIHVVILLPLVPAIVLIMLMDNLTVISDGVYATTAEIRTTIVQDYLFLYEMIVSVLTAFFLVYRWSQSADDGSYGFWVTQGVDPEKYIIVVVGTFSVLITLPQVIGLLVVMNYLGMAYTFGHFLAFLFASLFTNLILVLVALYCADFIPRHDLASIIFLTFAILNITLNTDTDSILFDVFKAEYIFFSSQIIFSLLFEFFLIVALLLILLYSRNYKEIKL